MPPEREDDRLVLDPGQLHDYIDRKGPFLFHVTREDAVKSILRDGLRPGSERGVSTAAGFFRTRAGRVYLGDLRTLAVVKVAGARAYLRVDLRQLDSSCLDPDEDRVQDSFDRRGNGWVAQPPPTNTATTDPEFVGQALADWADATEGFDAPEVSAKSLESGRVAYRGVVPPEAIKVVRFPSEGPELFRAGVLRVLDKPPADLPTAPLLGYYETEVARATALARSIIASAARAAGESPDHILPDWPQPEHALTTRDLLTRARRERAQNGEWDKAEVLHAALQVAETAAELQPELGWAPTRDACVAVAQAAVEVVGRLQQSCGAETAAAAAATAMEAAAAVSDPD